MKGQKIPLAHQVDMIFLDLYEELKDIPGGSIMMEIRNRTVGVFGVRHYVPEEAEARGMRGRPAEVHLDAFRELAVAAVREHRDWSRGQLTFTFSMTGGRLGASVHFDPMPLNV